MPKNPARNPRLPPWLACLVVALAWMAGFGCGSNGDPFEIFSPNEDPSLMVIRPEDQATGVSVKTLVTLAFPVDLDPQTLQRSNFQLLDSRGIAVARDILYHQESRVVTIRPSRDLDERSIYQTVVQGVRSRDRKTEFRSSVFTFATGEDDGSLAPEVVAVTPVSDQANVNVRAPLVITFSEPMDRDSVVLAFSISLDVEGSLSFDTENKVLTFTPGENYPLGRTLQIQISRLARNQAGIPLARDFLSTFRTPNPDSFRVLASVPADGATTAAPGDPFIYTFSEPVLQSTLTTNFLVSVSGNPLTPVTDGNFSLSNNDQVVTFSPGVGQAGFVGLPSGATVVTTFSEFVQSAVSGIGLRTPFRASFQIEALPPQVLATTPQNGDTNQSATQIIRVRFSEAVQRASINATNFQVTQGPAIPGTFSFEEGDRVVVFTPTANYQNVGVPVAVRLGTGILDLGGTALATAVDFNFFVDTQPPFLESAQSFPMNGETEVPVTLAPNGVLIFDFNEALDQAQTEASFAIAPDSGGGGISFSSPDTLIYQPPVITPPNDPPQNGESKRLNGSTTYTVTFNAFDAAGNSSPVNVSFSTDSQAPTAIGQPQGTTADTNPVVSVSFSELMNRDTYAGAVTFRQVQPVVQDLPVTPNPGDFGLDFSPGPLVSGATYQVVVDTAVTDLAGNPLAAPLDYMFTVP